MVHVQNFKGSPYILTDITLAFELKDHKSQPQLLAWAGQMFVNKLI